MDTGAKHIGVAAISSGSVVYQAEVKLRGDEIKGKMDQRRMYRRTRRGRKTRYRKPRFLNRGNSTKTGRIPPSVRHKLQAHDRERLFVESILPVTKWVVETAAFDIAKLSLSDNVATLKGADYQNGRQKGFYNAKAFVLQRDAYKCQYGKGKCSKILHVHHIIFRSNGGTDKPENLITLCKIHHDALHAEKLGTFLSLEKSLARKASTKVKGATQISMIAAHIRRNWWNITETFGYETKLKREALGLPKTHYNDAVAICLNEKETVEISNIKYSKRLVSKGDYQQTSGSRSEKTIPTGKLFGLRKFDLISTPKGTGFVKGKRSSGFFAISLLDGESITDSVSVTKNTVRLSARALVLISRTILAKFLPAVNDGISFGGSR